MADIAAEASISQGLAYRYFSGKGEIFATLVKEVTASGGGPAERIKQIKGTPSTRLALIVTYILEDRRQNPGFSQLLYQALADDSTPGDLRQRIFKSGKAIQDLMRQLVVEGQATGEVAKGDPDEIMVALLACFDGLVKRATMLSPEDNAKHFPDARVILRMLKPDQGAG